MKEILDRANVGRSTFYTHFRDKDDLLESGIHEILQSTQRQPRRGGPLERVLAFSLPLLAHIDEHRRAPGPRMTREGRIVMHQRMQHALTALIADELGQSLPRRPHAEMPTSLLAQHVASTFVLVLDWWIESDTPLTPAKVDSRFRALVVPALAAL